MAYYRNIGPCTCITLTGAPGYLRTAPDVTPRSKWLRTRNVKTTTASRKITDEAVIRPHSVTPTPVMVAMKGGTVSTDDDHVGAAARRKVGEDAIVPLRVRRAEDFDLDAGLLGVVFGDFVEEIAGLPGESMDGEDHTFDGGRGSLFGGRCSSGRDAGAQGQHQHSQQVEVRAHRTLLKLDMKLDGRSQRER